MAFGRKNSADFWQLISHFDLKNIVTLKFSKRGIKYNCYQSYRQHSITISITYTLYGDTATIEDIDDHQFDHETYWKLFSTIQRKSDLCNQLTRRYCLTNW